jgi:hypothetical protein
MFNQNILSSSKKNCVLRHDDSLLKEGDEVAIITKLYKVENCQLQRAYQACGAQLWVAVNIVCEGIDEQKHKYTNRFRRFSQEKLLIESCCLRTCTVHEMAQFCP